MKPKGNQTTPTLSNSEYKSLVSEITVIYKNSLLESDSDWNKSILMGNWSIGNSITFLFDSNPTISKYGEQIIKNISKELSRDLGKGFSPRNLRSFFKFYKLYPKAKINPLLSWSHYSLLLAVDDPIKRKSLETRAIQKKLSFREIRTLILKKFPKSSSDLSTDEKTHPLKIPDLKLYTYKTSTTIPSNTPLLDLGFSIFTSLPSKVRQSKITTITSKPHYTYKAFLKKVIDGDTIEVLIDLGFSNYTTQRLRLNSIDTPELPSREGLKAKKFIEKILEDVSFIIIKTHSHDKYDRYLVDVFFLEGNVSEEDVLRNRRFLNQEVLDAGMGWRW